MDAVAVPEVRLPDRVDDLLIEGGAVVTVDDEFTIHDPGWVRVQAGRGPPGLVADTGHVLARHARRREWNPDAVAGERVPLGHEARHV